MLCSPSHLFIDMTMWYSTGYFEHMVAIFHNLSQGDSYDCGLVSAPCGSNITRALLTFDTSEFFWFDVFVVYSLLGVVVLAGIAGNVINVVIFSTSSIASDSTNSLLLALSVSDLLNLVNSAVLLISCVLCFVDNVLALTVFNHSFPQVTPISRFISLLSLDFVTVISIQRAVAIVFPFKVSTIFSQRNTNIVITVLTLVTVGATLVVNFAFYPRWLYHPYFDRTISLGSSERLNYGDIIDYITYYLSTRSCIDLVVIFVTGSLTVFNLWSQAKKRASLKAVTPVGDPPTSKRSAREANAIRMSLTVCLATFIIYMFILIANSIIQKLFEELFKTPLPIMCMYSLFLLNSIGSAFNFFLYLVMSPKYKEIILGICCGRGDNIKQ